MRTKRVSLVALLALAVVVTGLTGCGRKGLIRVNGDKVAKEEFIARLERVPVQTAAGRQFAGQYVIEQIIAEKLMQQLAKEQGVEPTEEQIEKKVNTIKKQSGGDLRNLLQQRGLTMEDMKRQVAVEQAMINVMTKDVKVPEADIKKAYNEALNVENSPFKRPEQVRISAILVAETNKAKIDKVYKLLKDGQEFGSVASKMSENPGAAQTNGVIGWVSRDLEQVPKVIRDHAFSLQAGKFSEPFRVEDSFIIVRADQKRAAKTQAYSDVKDILQEQLAIQEGSRKTNYGELIQKFTEKSEIVVNAERYKDVPEKMKKDAAAAIEQRKEQLKSNTSAVPPTDQ